MPDPISPEFLTQATRSDPMLTTVDEIRSLASEYQFVVFYGWLLGKQENTVDWNSEHGGDWKNFLNCARALGVKVIYLNWSEFESFQVDDALKTESDEQPGMSEEEKQTLQEYNCEVEKYRENVGLTAVIDLAFQHAGIIHNCNIYADWFGAFEELTAMEEETEDGETGEEQVDRAVVNKWAEGLAGLPKFGTCKNDEQREYLLERLAGEEFEKLPIGHILRRADTLYVFEIRPKQEEQLRNEARDLRAQGRNMNTIALKLGISRDRVSGLLAE